MDTHQARNRENRRQQYRENRSAHVATIAALIYLHLSEVWAKHVLHSAACLIQTKSCAVHGRR